MDSVQSKGGPFGGLSPPDIKNPKRELRTQDKFWDLEIYFICRR